MSSGHDLPRVVVADVVARMDERPRHHVTFIGLLLIGVTGFVVGALGDPARAWTALVWNWVFWTGMAMGGVVVTAATTITGGRWLTPVRRLTEGMTAFLPVSFLLMIVLFFGLEHVYSWIEHPVTIKQAYLNRPFFIVRQAGGALVLYSLAMIFVYWSLRPDLGRLREHVTGWREGLYGRLTRGWQGLDLEVERAARVRQRMAPAIAVLYALIWSIFAWDWVMSVDPHWYSTLFAAWIFMAHFLVALSATAVITVTQRGYRSFADLMNERTLHDIGKMVFAFSVFWTYLFFAQYLVIWYGRLPEETGYVKLRLWHAYEPIAIVVLLAVFLIPFLGLLGVHPKRTPALLRGFATTSLIGLLSFHLILIAPGVFPDHLALGWIELAVTAGMFGLFALCYGLFMRAFPMIAIVDEEPVDPEVEEASTYLAP